MEKFFDSNFEKMKEEDVLKGRNPASLKEEASEGKKEIQDQ